ncbi:MAG: tetratricopeptide repeat protein [Bacteroidetes bacterium]|nr:tetratricopeptide repeat protein [Bacteroidota bacterium]
MASVMLACNIDQKSVTSNFFHNTTAHYNGFYYAREKAREVEKAILKTLDDDPTQILRLFPGLDTVKAKAYVKDTDEIIKMASISIQRHPNSKWVDDNYIQVGRARLYSCDFQNAILTFKYVNTKSPSPDVRHLALVYLLRTFTEMGDFDRGEEVFRFLEKEKLSRDNAKRLYLEKAYHYQLKNDYDNMVQNLSKADTLLAKSDRKGRIYFIIGQVYQKLGFNSEAYNFYRKCLATNPDYEIDFYARLNMAQVAKLDDKRDAKLVRKQFAKMLGDAKNAEFRDKIFYEWGEFERKQGLVIEAITQYTQAAHAGKSKRIQGQAYLRTGQLYFDTLKKYSLAKLYYDSAVGALPKDFENLDAIKKRQELLGQFAKYTEAITLNDSLLYLASLDTAVVRKKLDSVFAARDKKIAASKKKKKRNDNGGGGGNNTPFVAGQSSGTSDWYFGNPDLVASGQSEFQRIWGNIPLEDNWRRSNKTAATDATAAAVAQPIAQTDTGDKTNLKDLAPSKDEKADEVGKLIALLPRTEKQQKEALAKIEEGYYKLGDLYYFNLNEKRNAYDSYTKLLERFPSSEFKPEALYKLFLIFRETDPAKAATYAQMLKDQFPNATVTKIMLNPNYLKETSVAAEKQKLIYKEAYTLFQQNNLRAAQERLALAYREGETGFTPQLDLFKILIIGKTEDVSKYQYELETFIKKYPAEPSKAYAEELLASSKNLLAKLEKAKGIQFSNVLNGPHYFVTIHKSADKITNAVDDALDKFGNAQWKDLKLTTSNLALNDESIITMVVEFPDKEAALGYFDKFLAQLTKSKPFSNYKFYNFVISKENFQTFYRTKALDEYLTFFDRNYQKQNQ